MPRNFKELRSKMSPIAQIKSKKMASELIEQIPLQELRRARALSQQTLASAMGVPQSAVSKLEKRTDAYVSTLRNYLHAMGGELKIFAEFPDGTRVAINQFQEIGPERELIES